MRWPSAKCVDHVCAKTVILRRPPACQRFIGRQADEGSTAASDSPCAICTWRHLRGGTSACVLTMTRLPGINPMRTFRQKIEIMPVARKAEGNVESGWRILTSHDEHRILIEMPSTTEIGEVLLPNSPHASFLSRVSLPEVNEFAISTDWFAPMVEENPGGPKKQFAFRDSWFPLRISLVRTSGCGTCRTETEESRRQ